MMYIDGSSSRVDNDGCETNGGWNERETVSYTANQRIPISVAFNNPNLSNSPVRLDTVCDGAAIVIPPTNPPRRPPPGVARTSPPTPPPTNGGNGGNSDTDASSGSGDADGDSGTTIAIVVSMLVIFTLVGVVGWLMIKKGPGAVKQPSRQMNNPTYEPTSPAMGARVLSLLPAADVSDSGLSSGDQAAVADAGGGGDYFGFDL